MKKQDKSIHSGAHKYYRAQYSQSKTVLFRCGLAGCPHFVYEPLILNRISECWRCGEEFQIVGRTLRAKKFHCEDCTRGREKKASTATVEAIDSLLSNLGLDKIAEISESKEKMEEERKDERPN